jgi:uncharacterized zinc-type alcohol dehydrogenase-like protein
MVSSCGKCDTCVGHEEQFCSEGVVWTYNSKYTDGSATQGGYSTHYVVDSK